VYHPVRRVRSRGGKVVYAAVLGLDRGTGGGSRKMGEERRKRKGEARKGKGR